MSGPDPTEPPGLGRRVATGATWVVSQRMAVRLIGIASTLVLARLLVPADFGLIALATAVAGVLDALAELGFDLALIQKRTTTRQDWDTVWTLCVLRGIAIAAILIAAAWPLAALYDDPRLVTVMAWLAFGSFVAGLQNVGIVEFRRELRFEREFALLVWTKLGSFVVTLVLAWWWRDHHALLAGIVTGRVAATALSYAMHPYRPRLGLAGAGAYLHFSKWMAINSAISAARSRLDAFVVGKAAGDGALGIYTVAQEIAGLALSELIAPISRAVHPGFAKMAGDRERLARGYLDLFALIGLVAIPIAVGIALTAEHVVRVFLGWKWLEAVPLIQIMTLHGLVQLTAANSGALYLGIGRPDLLARRNLPPLLVLIPALLYGASQHGTIGAAWALVLSAGVGFAVNVVTLQREIGVRIGAMMRSLARPAAATLAMAAAVVALDRAWPVALPVPIVAVQLAALAAVGATVYATSVLALWSAAGRPAGAEQRVLALLGDAARRLAGRG